MRKFLIFLTICLMLAVPSLAEEATQSVRGSGFSLQLPAAWTVDVDEYTRGAYPIVDHVLHPTFIFAGDENYDLVVTLYNHTSDTRYRLAGKGDRAQEHFNLIAEHSGLTNTTGVLSSRIVRALYDVRNFVFCQIPGTDAHLATYYNPDKGQGYTFQLTRKNPDLTVAEAEALLLEIASTLREDGLFYPADATGRNVIITNASAHIRAAADQNSTIIKTASQGESFPYYGQTSTWYIIDVNGITGYVSTALSVLQ